jgi:chromosomal replication initiation ATPase DnaA
MGNELTILRPHAAIRPPRARARAGASNGDPERLVAFLIDNVARGFRVRASVLTAPGRTAAREALARHVAMYLAHVMFGWTYSQVAGVFCRHRTSVLYACARVEDRRDDPGFDARIARLERDISSALDAVR